MSYTVNGRFVLTRQGQGVLSGITTGNSIASTCGVS